MPAAIRFLLEPGCFAELDSVAAAPDIAGLVELGSVAAAADIFGLDTASPPGAAELLSDASIFPSLAHPPTSNPKKASQRRFLNIGAPPVVRFGPHPLLSQGTR